MDYAVKEIEPDVWRVDVEGTTRIVRYRPDGKTFTPWDICTADGRRLWGSPTLESAFRWIQARTGQPTEAILAEGLLAQTASNKGLENPDASQILAEQEEPGTVSAVLALGRA
jgi:hypothetical protein